MSSYETTTINTIVGLTRSGAAVGIREYGVYQRQQQKPGPMQRFIHSDCFQPFDQAYVDQQNSRENLLEYDYLVREDRRAKSEDDFPCDICSGYGNLTVEEECLDCDGTGEWAEEDGSNADACGSCDGTGHVNVEESCDDCDGTGCDEQRYEYYVVGYLMDVLGDEYFFGCDDSYWNYYPNSIYDFGWKDPLGVENVDCGDALGHSGRKITKVLQPELLLRAAEFMGVDINDWLDYPEDKREMALDHNAAVEAAQKPGAYVDHWHTYLLHSKLYRPVDFFPELKFETVPAGCQRYIELATEYGNGSELVAGGFTPGYKWFTVRADGTVVGWYSWESFVVENEV